MENEKKYKGINYATFALKQEIIKIAQESELPITNIKYVLLELINEIFNLENQQIEKEKEEYIKSLKNETQDVKNQQGDKDGRSK